VTRRELPHIPSATALLRRCKHIAASGPPGRQNIANTRQPGTHGEQNPHQSRNEPISQNRSRVQKGADKISQITKSP
jgi:hypothetical protein